LVLDNAKDDSTWRANGVAASSVEAAYTLNTDEWYRLRVLMVNVGSQATGGLLTFDDGCEVRPIAHDGIFRMQVPGNVQMEYHLTSSSRLDVAIKCQSDSGIRVDGATVATVSVTGQGDATLTPFDSSTDQPWKTTRLDYVADLCRPEVIVDAYWNVRVDETNINGQSYDIDYPLCNDENDFDYGTIQEWSIEGADTHPFHLHMYPMQVVGDCGIAHEVGEYYDTIVSAGSAHSTCQVRIRLVDVAGPAVMHCHIFEHAEQGAMGYINVVGGPDPTTTDVPRCSSFAACQDVATNVVVKCSGSDE
jgi:FtsP/CotA-like multicopper oxidase with cupredoxin domain